MNRYDTPKPSPAFALGAALATAAVLSIAVYLPASSAPAARAPLAVADDGVEVTIAPSRIDVVGLRDAHAAASAHVHEARSPKG
jgi:hypothetical protein